MEDNKAILQTANAAIDASHYEGFLEHCTDDTEWVFVGGQTLSGKEAVRQYMAETYLEPPVNKVDMLIGDGNYVTITGSIKMKQKDGLWEASSYCDVWEFRNGKMAKLMAYVIKAGK